MVQTFLTEADLERSFRNRFGLLDESLKSSAISTKNLRQSLLGLLRQANALEMENKPVGKRMIDRILAQQQELRQLIALQKRQTNERAELDVQFQSALLRYRELKRSLEEGTAPPVATAVAPTPAGG
jgi:regulator of replication initiation timing